MGSGLILGQYVPGSSPMHRLDPRTKMVLATLLIISVFFVRGWWGFGAFLILLALFTALARIPPGYLLRGMRPVFAFAVFTFLFQLVFTGQGVELWRLGPLRVTDTGLVLGAFMSLRLIVVVLLVLAVTLTTSPVEISEGIERLGRPLGRFGLNSYELALVAAGALRFVPTLVEQADKVKRAQMARGVNFESGNIIVRARKMLPLLVPLFVNAVRRAEDLGMAMEARCYQGGKGRVARRQLIMTRADYVAYIVALCFAGALILLHL